MRSPIAQSILQRWHLVRCANCHKMIISYAIKCPHCETVQKDARFFMVASGTLLLATISMTAYLMIHHSIEEHRKLKEAYEMHTDAFTRRGFAKELP